MTRLLQSRHAVKVAGAAFAGIVTALALATPAFACHTPINPVIGDCTDAGEATVVWNIGHDNGYKQKITSATVTPTGTTLNPDVVGKLIPRDGLQTEQVVPNDVGDVSLTLLVNFYQQRNGHWRLVAENVKAEGTATIGDICEQPTPPPAPATVSANSDCDTFTITVNNPENGVEVQAKLTPSTGDEQTVTVAPGKSEDVKFPGSEGLKVTVLINDQTQEFSYTKPDNCATPPPSASPSASTPAGGGGGGGGTLPVTGTSAGIAGGIAVVLLGIGGVVFYLFRRRRIHFVS